MSRCPGFCFLARGDARAAALQGTLGSHLGWTQLVTLSKQKSSRCPGLAVASVAGRGVLGIHIGSRASRGWPRRFTYSRGVEVSWFLFTSAERCPRGGVARCPGLSSWMVAVGGAIPTKERRGVLGSRWRRWRGPKGVVGGVKRRKRQPTTAQHARWCSTINLPPSGFG